MPDIWMDVDTALAEVPVNMMPLIDDTDFKTVEDAVAYNAAGMDLRWNFVTTGGAYTSTAVTPTTAGSYDWTHQGDGMYSIEMPASGGASINNDTEGFGWFSGKITGVLPFRGPVIGFRAAALNNALIDGGDVLGVNMVQISGDSGAADNLEAACDGTGYNVGSGSIVAASVTGAVGSVAGNVDGSVASVVGAVGSVTGSVGSVSGDVGGSVLGSVSGSVGSVTAGVTISGTITTLDALDSTLSSAHGAGSWATATGFSTHSATDVWAVGTRELTSGAAPSVSDIWSHGTRTLTANPGDSAATIADAVWDEALSGHIATGSAGEALAGAGSAGDPWATSLPGAYSAGTAGYIVGTNLNATVGSRSSHSAADVWSVATRVLTASTNIVLAKGVGVTGFNDLSAAQVNAEADAALSDVGLTSTVTGRIDVATSTRLASASYTAPLDAAGTRTALGLAAANLDAQLTAIDTVVDTILDDTGTAGVVLSSATRDAIAASLLDLAAGVQTSWTLREALRVILAAAAGKISGADTSTVTIRDPGDTKDRIVASVAASGRTSVTYDKS